MIAACIVAVVVYAVCVYAHGTRLTPDGHIYLAMGRGAKVPRPYALYALPMVMRGVASWRVLHAASYLTVAVCTALLADRHGMTPWPVVGLVVTLPMMRQGVTWPVLLDMPMMAAASLVAVLAPSLGPWLLPVILATYLIHVRAPLWAALYAWPYASTETVVLAAVIAGAVAYLHYEATKPHPQEASVPWLRDPFGAAVAKHMPTMHDARVWIVTWAGGLFVLASGSVHAYVCMAAGYAACLVAQDRVRIYQMAAVPVALAACNVLGDYAAMCMILNWFTTTQEV